MRSHSRSGDGAVTPPGPGLSRGVTAPLAPPTPPAQPGLGCRRRWGCRGAAPRSGAMPWGSPALCLGHSETLVPVGWETTARLRAPLVT